VTSVARISPTPVTCSRLNLADEAPPGRDGVTGSRLLFLAGVPDLETGLIAADRGSCADGESFFARYGRVTEPGVVRHVDPVRHL
jgi:hypothetical protein